MRINKSIAVALLEVSSILPYYDVQGRSQDFSKGGSQRLLTRCSPSCISGLSRIIAA